ncbi:MAG: DUF2235 domain-containing protein [Gammaproteobacteria bacterium]|jgi:uncharacterized protein (DUF2235 family)|nr:DUF2235 domain-containing protein [Gammaproteobacteria bacterium]
MAKNIVVCCDGTGNEFGIHNSNIVRISQLCVYQEEGPGNQIVYYDPGIGTLDLPSESFIDKYWTSKILGEGFGYGLEENIKDAYLFLMEKYQEGDRVFLFGFSRGAYTVRALAGMLSKLGLLRNGSENLYPYVSQIYRRKDYKIIADQFKQSFCVECKPWLIGVFDTVAALGTFYRKKVFPNGVLNADVKYGYHALSIDEKRKPFQPFLWEKTTDIPDQIIEQVWFAGVHSDIGGGYTATGLSDIALKWMLKKAQSKGLFLKDNWEDQVHPDPLGKMHESYNLWWKIIGPGSKTRTILPNSLIHRSVFTRMEHNNNYHPALPNDYTIVD